MGMTPETEKILNFAISEEQAAHDFYMGMAEKMESEWMKDVFRGFAKEELGHKSKLEKIKSGDRQLLPQSAVADLKIGDYLVQETPSTEMSYQDALIIAMKKEKAAFKLYSDLAKTTEDEGLREILQGLANEEAKHKLRFEVEYDDNVLSEN
jgi:rubrerythrin